MKDTRAKQVTKKESGFLRTLAEFDRSDIMKTVVAVREYQGRRRLDVRDYYRPEDGKEYYPTKRGTSIYAENLDDFIAAIQAAQPLMPPRE